MVAKQIQRELADMLTRDPIMQRAVLPEAALGADRYLSSLTNHRRRLALQRPPGRPRFL